MNKIKAAFTKTPHASLMRLQKAIAQKGVASRRAAEKLIAAGKVTVNEKTITEMGTLVDPTQDLICINNVPLTQKPERIVIALYKPKGIVSTCKDPQGRETVIDLIPEKYRKGLHPIGRLDKDSEGLILLTNDGDLTLKLSHPRYEKEKIYRVTIQGTLTEEARTILERGVMLDGTKTAPCRIKKISATRASTILECTLYEGRNRQIRRMFEMIGTRVLYLCRTHISTHRGEITLAQLTPGKYRILKNI